MKRAVSVLVSVLILLFVGWYFGQRPVGGLEDRLEEQEARCQTEKAELESALGIAEARGGLWAAHAELVLAAHDVEKRNFGLAAERVETAHDLITRAAATPGLILSLDSVQQLVEAVRTRLGGPDPAAPGLLNRAAAELKRVLSQMGQA